MSGVLSQSQLVVFEPYFHSKNETDTFYFLRLIKITAKHFSSLAADVYSELWVNPHPQNFEKTMVTFKFSPYAHTHDKDLHTYKVSASPLNLL